MTKKEDLKLVFEFIADFLREDTDDSKAKSAPKEEIIEEVKPKSKMESFIESINPPNVKDIMERVEKFDNTPTFPNNPLLGDRERELEETLNRVSKQVDSLVKERNSREENRLADFIAKQDFSVIKENRNNVSSEEREAIFNQPSYLDLKSILARAKKVTDTSNDNISFSG